MGLWVNGEKIYDSNAVATVSKTVDASDDITLSTRPTARLTIITVTNTDTAETCDKIIAGAAWINKRVQLRMATVGGGETLAISDGANFQLPGNFTMNSTEDAIELECISANVFRECFRVSPS